MKLLRDHPVSLFITCIALLLTIVILNFPGSRAIDVTLTATEYRLDDPDFAVEHTVSVQGRDTRNLLGKGRFQGTVAVSGLEGTDTAQSIVLTFGESLKTEGRVSTMDAEGFVSPGGGAFGPVFLNRNCSEFVWILANEVHETGASYGGGSARFLISGPADREEAFAMAAKLTRGSFWEPLFSE